MPLYNQGVIEDIWKEVFQYSKSNLVALSCVSGWLNKSIRDYFKNYQPEGCFGTKEWNDRGANLKNVPSVPLKMIQKFDPFNWMLTFIPKEINEEPLTLSRIDRFVSDCKNGKDTFKTNYFQSLEGASIDDKTAKSFEPHWVLLSKDVLGGNDVEKGTRNKDFKKQQAMVNKSGYEIPHLIDVVTSLFMHHLATGKFIYEDQLDDQEATFTSVKEKNWLKFRLIVGGFAANGLHVGTFHTDHIQIGASCALKSID